MFGSGAPGDDESLEVRSVSMADDEGADERDSSSWMRELARVRAELSESIFSMALPSFSVRSDKSDTDAERPDVLAAFREVPEFETEEEVLPGREGNSDEEAVLTVWASENQAFLVSDENVVRRLVK